jgi:hypothetical protein
MENAKKELLKELEGKARVKCAWINHFIRQKKDLNIALKVNYTIDEYEAFLKALDFKYDNGYGGQQLSGEIWLDDGTWMERGEYDGSEWWEHRICPDIPEECL